jgi:uncharacterized membrane protein
MVFPIMISNAALAVTFGLVSGIGGRKSTTFRIIGILIASFVKFLILSTTVKYLVQVPGPLAKMMQGTQLATALIGGALALILIEILSRTGMFSETTGGTGRS